MTRKWIVLVLLLGFLFSANQAIAYPKKVERWRPLAKNYLKKHKVYSSARLNHTMNIIDGESGGSAGCSTGGYSGLIQMDSSWKWWPHIKRRHNKALKQGKGRYVGHRKVKKWQDCGACQLHRLAHVWKHSDAKVRQHWAATYW